MKDEVCILGLCAEVDVPPATLDPTGHSVLISPSNPEDWLDGGSAILFNSAAPNTPLSTAFVSAGFVVGDSQVMVAKFALRETLSAESGAIISANSLASTSDAEPC